MQLMAQNIAGPQAKFIYDLSYDYLIPNRPVDDLQQAWFSNGHSFSFMGEWPFGEGYGLGYGFGFSVHNLHNNLAFVQVQPDPLDAGTLTLASDSSYNVNEQNLGYFDLPIEFRFRGRSTPKGNFFRFSLGAKIGYRIYAAAYHRNADEAIREYRVFNTAPFRLKAYARVGVGKLALYAGYDFMPTLMEEHPGFVPADYEPIDFHMMSVGISLLL